MAIYYKNQSQLEALARKSGNTSSRLSEQRRLVYGGRGQKYDELVYLNGQNADAATVNRKDADAWVKFASANGGTTNRADQEEREFYKQGNYP